MISPPSANAAKENVMAIEKVMEEGEVEMSPELRKLDRQTVARLDLMLLPNVIIMYLLAYLDRANIGNARVVSMVVYIPSPMDHEC